MTTSKNLKQRLVAAVLVLVMMFTSLIGTTFAWFTDEVTSAGNKIVSGSLKIDLRHEVKDGKWVSVKDDSDHLIFDYDNWEPGYTNIETLEIVNLGNLALQYRLSIELEDGTAILGENGENLADVIDVYTVYGNAAASSYDDITKTGSAWVHEGTLADVLRSPSSFIGGQLLPTGETLKGGEAATTAVGAQTVRVALHMQESAGNGYQGLSVGNIYVNLIATQWSYESDSFDNGYDNGATFPTFKGDYVASEKVELNADNTVKSEVNLSSKEGEVSATVPSGVLLEAGTDEVTLTVSSLDETASNVQVKEDQVLNPLDVHVSGVAAGNTKPILVTVKELLAKGLNMGNYELYHVEDGSTVKMTYVQNSADLDAHNEFTYDPATGDVVMALCSFSEIAVVAEPSAWEGNFDYSWYTNVVAVADGEAVTEYLIANADQLAAFGAIVGGMAKDENGNYIYTATDGEDEEYHYDSFSGKTVKLVADINLGDKETENNPDIIFYPIGYYNSEGTYDRTNTAITSGLRNFEGTFDGNGNTISNFYQNTWEMKGDHDWYSPEEQYYRDGMGLFGKVYGGTVKNLTVSNFSSDGEIATTGVIAAYAEGTTFENIAIFNCNPRVYNIGNGGIVGCVGWYAKEAGLTTKFTNITVDNSNKISALWGSYDVACGGIVGQYYPTSGQTSAGTPKNAGIEFTNCHISAQMDVYNDVCANYQYYAYRYTGMLIGSVRENETIDGHVYPKMDGITASGCTVHFGTWNDYYYCEIIDNTTASYTHDYQMSRLVEIKAIDGTTITYLDGTTGTVPASGRANYVIVDYTKGHGTDNATCYHFKDGEVWNHEDAGYHDGTDGGKIIDENGDGSPDLREDKQHIYLEFNNLVTGYGWGVTSRGFANLDGVTNLDIAQGEHEESVNKFTPVIDNGAEYDTGSTVTVGDLFAAIENAGVAIKVDNVQVAISPFGSTSTAGGAYAANTADWTQGTLTFSGIGQAVITITDYYFCKTTTVTVNIVVAEKFDTNFVNYNAYLYRVGNADESTVALGTIFKHNGNGTIDAASLNVAFEPIAGNASGTFAANTTDWANGTIQFSGTGVVKVTIKDNTSKEFSLNLEVVDATNITSATAGTGKNFVLLQDVTYSGTYLYYKNSTLYGNGFTIDITGADHSDLKDSSDTNSNKSAYCNIWMVDSRFDNVRIVGSVYPEVGMTADADYGNAAIRTEGDCYITNSYISNCRVPLRVQGNTTLINTVVDGGRYANIELRSGELTLDGVTTINTVRKGSDGTTDVIGFGIVIHSEAANASISVIGDGLKQYNWVGENKHKTILTGDTYLSNAYKLIFNANNSDTIYFDYSDDRYVSTGILCLCADMNKDVVAGLDDRYYQEVSGYDAWVLTYDNSKHTAWFNESVGTTTVKADHKQYPVLPTYSGNEAKTVEFTKGETHYFDTSVLTAEKFGQTLEISSVVMNGTTYNYGEKIAIIEGGVFEIIYTIVDPYNYNADATPTTEVYHIESITLTSVVKDAEILAPKFTFIDQNGNKYESKTIKVGDKTYVMPNVTAADPTTNSMSSINIGSATISGTTVYFPVATGYTVRSGSNFNRYYPLFNGINITDYTIAGDTTGTTYTTSGNYTSLVGSSGTKFIIPANGGQTNCGDYVKTDGQAGNAAGNSDSGWQGSGYSTSYGGTYLKSGNTNASSGADSNGYERIVWVEYCFNAGNGDVYYYRIGYHCNKEAAQTGCVTPDTLVTLADGSQKRIDEVTYADRLLVWDFYKGEYAAVSPAIIFDHGIGNNTVIKLNFSDGTSLKVVNLHQLFDVDMNKLVSIDASSVADYVGHSFAKMNGDGFESVTLVDYTVTEEYVEAWGIISAEHYNIFVEGMLSADFEKEDYDLFNYFEIGENMTFDEEKMQADIEKYGLYTYEDFADYLTYDQFVAFNVRYFKVAVGKGYYTFDGILALIDEYLNV